MSLSKRGHGGNIIEAYGKQAGERYIPVASIGTVVLAC
jgi:hypothetical protein